MGKSRDHTILIVYISHVEEKKQMKESKVTAAQEPCRSGTYEDPYGLTLIFCLPIFMHEAVNMPDGNFTITYSYFYHPNKKEKKGFFDNLVHVPAHVNIKL